MATKEQKEELIEILKFTPATYKIEMYAYGGEVYAGTVDRKVYDYFKKRKLDLDEYANDWDNNLNVPDEFQPFPPGSPYECDNLVHASGATLDNGNVIEITDDRGNIVWTSSLDINVLEEEGVDVEEWESFDSEEIPDGDVVYWGAQGDKGLCFGGEIELKAPFDPKKLKIQYSNADGWYLCGSVLYDGEDIDNNDLSTNGKWGENKWLLGSNEEVYESVSSEDTEEESEELEISEEIPPMPELPLTDWFPKDINPAYKGEYEVELELAAWPFPSIIRANWTGRTWKQNGKKIKIKQWRGLTEQIL